MSANVYHASSFLIIIVSSLCQGIDEDRKHASCLSRAHHHYLFIGVDAQCLRHRKICLAHYDHRVAANESDSSFLETTLEPILMSFGIPLICQPTFTDAVLKTTKRNVFQLQ